MASGASRDVLLGLLGRPLVLPTNIEALNEVRDDYGTISRLMNNPAREDAVFFALILNPDLYRLI